jgi:hypothetical protein
MKFGFAHLSLVDVGGCGLPDIFQSSAVSNHVSAQLSPKVLIALSTSPVAKQPPPCEAISHHCTHESGSKHGKELRRKQSIVPTELSESPAVSGPGSSAFLHSSGLAPQATLLSQASGNLERVSARLRLARISDLGAIPIGCHLSSES